MKLEILNQYSLAFDFINPSGLGYGNSTPVRVGMLNGKPFFANFHIDIKGNNEAYSLSYTFLQKEVENG
ncbi:DUF6864 domain-containing function [Aeromonas veronii]|uniref:DUF6864 domain-containing function n=1 Tax=Aeromonas veronii TaxID=654 RepID=UPI003C6F69CE